MFNLHLYHCFHFYLITFIIVTLIILVKVLYLAFNVMQSCSPSINQIRYVVMLGIILEYWSEREQRKYRKSSEITSLSQTLKAHCDIPGWCWEPFIIEKLNPQYTTSTVHTVLLYTLRLHSLTLSAWCFSYTNPHLSWSASAACRRP